MTAALFWLAAGFLALTYAGYPLMLRAWAAIRRRVPRGGGGTPSVTVVIVAHNEADCIRQKVDNLLALDYPPDRLDVVVASDGSTDDTVRRLDGLRSSNVRVIAYPDRRGKAAVLNEVVPSAAGDVVVLADARQRFDSRALRALVAAFDDPSVGAVGGELVLVDTHASGSEVAHGVGAYWRYEKFIRRHESTVDSTVGVSGAIYALRRELFRPIPGDIILDDVLIPMRVAEQGYRVLFEPAARAYDRTAPTADAEFRRKVRTLAGNFQLFAREPWLLAPWRNRLWLQTVGHKACRLGGPFALVAMLVASAMLAGQPFYAAALAAQIVFYGGALAGVLAGGNRRKSFLVNLPYTFCLLNWATVVGLVRWLSGRQTVIWQPNNVR